MNRCPTGRHWFDTKDEAEKYIEDLTRGMKIVGLPVTPFRAYLCIICEKFHAAPRKAS